MTVEDEKREIIVKAPSKTTVNFEVKTAKSLEKALEEERFEVLEFPKKISLYLGLTAIATGVWLVFLFVYMIITNQINGILLSSADDTPSLIVWGFVGLINLVIGFLFLGRE